MTKAAHRRWGKGSISLRGRTWSILLRVGVKRKSKRITLGTVDELPTKEDAQRAAEYLHAIGPETVFELMRNRHVSERPNLPVFTGEWFAKKLAEQEGRCAICRRVPKRLVVDHDHDTSALRGLLCSQCNSGIGMLRDDASLVRSALLYLESYDYTELSNLSATKPWTLQSAPVSLLQ